MFGINITTSWLYKKKNRHNGKWRYDKCNNVCNDKNTLAADKLMISVLNFDDKYISGSIIGTGMLDDGLSMAWIKLFNQIRHQKRHSWKLYNDTIMRLNNQR